MKGITKWSLERLADTAEEDYTFPLYDRHAAWQQVPGWRVVLGTASPVEPAQELFKHFKRAAREQSKQPDRFLRAAKDCRLLFSLDLSCL